MHFLLSYCHCEHAAEQQKPPDQLTALPQLVMCQLVTKLVVPHASCGPLTVIFPLKLQL